MKTPAVIYELAEFIKIEQLDAIVDGLIGEEGDFFEASISKLIQTIKTMPVTYQQEGLGKQAIIHLHYFLHGHDWFITELDVTDRVSQAFGLASLDGHEPELGYINIKELLSVGAELDLHWQAKTLEDVMTQIA